MKLTTRHFFFIVLALLLTGSGAGQLHAQTTGTIQEIVVTTNMETRADSIGTKQLITNLSGLRVGSALSQENVANAITTLWAVDLFSDIQILYVPVENGFRVTIDVDILQAINNVELEGFDEFRDEEILSAVMLTRGRAFGDRHAAQVHDTIIDMYHDKGFLAAELEISREPAIVLQDGETVVDSTLVDVTFRIDEGGKVKIKTINIVGNENIDDKKIKKTMRNTKEDRWYRSGEFKEDEYRTDREMIVALYQSEGFRDMEIARDSTYIDPETEKMILTIFVNEGQRYYYGNTTFDGNTFFTEDELREKIRYLEGDIFDMNQLYLSIYGYADQNIEGIETLYRDRGYLKTFINPVQTVRGDSIDIFIDIAEGSVSNVSKVIIEGNTKTIEKVIRREINLDPGQPFSKTLLDRSRRDVMALNFFSNVEYDYLLHNDDEDVDIVYKVAERQTGMASMGAGYSERDRLVGTLSFNNQNLFGRGQSINFNWDMGTRRKAFQIGFGEPWLFDTPTSFSFDLYNIVRSDYTTAFDEEKRRGASIRIGRDLRKWIDYTRAYVTYRLEDVDYSDASGYYSLYLVTGKTSSLSLSLIRDSRDLPQFATQGARTSASVEVAGGPFGGDLSYYKYLLNNEMYTPLFWNLSLMLRTRIGFLKGYQESRFVPYSERFMPGGTSWDGIVRGYPNRQVCPLLQGEEIGGETMLVNNLELQIPIVAQTLYGIAFYDFGNAWRSMAETNPFDTKRSAGIGARVFVPGIGNIGFDVGYGFDRIEGSSKVGGWKTHFQFGQMW